MVPVGPLTVLPFDLIFGGIATSDNSQPCTTPDVRILKLMRILRASRIISRWQDHVGLSYALMSLLKFTFLMMIVAHWLACLWGFISEEGSYFDTPWTHYVPSGEGISWRQKAKIGPDAGMYDLYVICLYVALNNIFGGACEINPANYNEFFWQTFMMFVGSSLWAYVIGSVWHHRDHRSLVGIGRRWTS